MTARPDRFGFAGRIRAVLFDAGNTLLWLDHERMAAISTAAGHAVGTDALRAAEMRSRPVLDPYLCTASKREGDDTSRRYAETIAAQMGLDPRARPGTDVVDGLLAAWSTLWIVPPADALPALAALEDRGLRVGCVSNSNGGVRGLLERAGLATRLGCIVDSGVEGVEKPDPRIFRLGCERLGVEPAHAVYVGDFLSIDVLGARGAGLEGVLLDPMDVWAGAADAVPRVASLTELVVRL